MYINIYKYFIFISYSYYNNIKTYTYIIDLYISYTTRTAARLLRPTDYTHQLTKKHPVAKQKHTQTPLPLRPKYTP